MTLTAPEWTIMQTVWACEPCSVRDVMDALAGQSDWAYTTVKTMMTRLVDKGALSVSKRGNVSVFQSQITKQSARHEALHALLDRAFDGTVTSLVTHMLKDEKLSNKDRRELQQIIRDFESSENS